MIKLIFMIVILKSIPVEQGLKKEESKWQNDAVVMPKFTGRKGIVTFIIMM